ncbi:hypothetical protein AAMO2058_000519200 [Amorphochlora amoebiformis]
MALWLLVGLLVPYATGHRTHMEAGSRFFLNISAGGGEDPGDGKILSQIATTSQIDDGPEGPVELLIDLKMGLDRDPKTKEELGIAKLENKLIAELVHLLGPSSTGAINVERVIWATNAKKTLHVALSFSPTTQSKDPMQLALKLINEIRSTDSLVNRQPLLSVADPSTLVLKAQPLKMTSMWGPWTACSASCGGGVRIRACMLENPSMCRGPWRIRCGEKPCIDFGWGPWTPCTSLCGGGYQTRVCKLETTTKRFPCRGSSRRVCNSQACPDGYNERPSSIILGEVGVAHNKTMNPHTPPLLPDDGENEVTSDGSESP